MTEQAEFHKYIEGLVRRLETIPQDEGECESPVTEVVRSRTGASGDSSKRGKDTLTMSNLVETLDDLFTAAKRIELLVFNDPRGIEDTPCTGEYGGDIHPLVHDNDGGAWGPELGGV
ncbi:SDR family NA [Sesbania bispinosa]|nr:SDR family NA [Sesbania bispinosa]